MTTGGRALLTAAAAAFAAAAVADGLYPLDDWGATSPAAFAHSVSAVLTLLAALLGPRGAALTVTATSAVGAAIAAAAGIVDAQGPGLDWASALIGAAAAALALLIAFVPVPASPTSTP